MVACKGGSGATFVATQVAHALAQGGRRRVLLIDLDLPFGDAALCLTEQAPMRGLADVAREFDRLDADLLRSSLTEVSPGLQVLAAPQDPSPAVELEPAQVRRIVQLARTTHDHVVIDVGRAFGAVALQALDLADRVGAVLQLTLPHVRDAQRLRRLLASLDLAPHKLRWIVNRHQRDGALKVEDLRRLLGASVVSTVPNQYEWAAAAVNQGRPVAEIAPRSPLARALAQLAGDLTAEDSPAAPNPVSRRLRWWRWSPAPARA
jgi:pilus assembly protein CpaE